MPNTIRSRCGALSHYRAGTILGIVPLALMAVFAWGCASTEPVEPPGVTLVDLDIVDATLFESTLDVAVRISNDNPEPIIIDGAVIKLELNGIKVGKGASDERLELPRLDSVVRRVELHMNHLALATRIKGIIEAKVLNYAVTGKVYVVRPSGSVRGMSFESRGKLDLRGEAAQADVLDAVAPGTVD
jgi:LEA14-like dessication related protein